MSHHTAREHKPGGACAIPPGLQPALGRWRRLVERPQRDWLILGSAPRPTLPDPMPDEIVLVCINNSGRTAADLGLKRPDLTIRAQRKAWDDIAGLSSGAVIWISKRPLLRERLSNRASWRHHADRWCRMSDSERMRMLEACLNLSIPAEGLAQPTNGVVAIVLALACGARRVIVSGISLTEGGHSYNDREEARRQVEPDRSALARIRDLYPQVVTTEAGLARETGLPLL
jgi:hypothetical protein